MTDWAAQAAQARALWERENEVVRRDYLFAHDDERWRALQDARPWRADPLYIKDVQMSAVALLKMVQHARAGGDKEVMGMMFGRVDGHTMVVVDAFALPVDGTETRVNAVRRGRGRRPGPAAGSDRRRRAPRRTSSCGSGWRRRARRAGARTSSGGTTRTPATARGCRAST